VDILVNTTILAGSAFHTTSVVYHQFASLPGEHLRGTEISAGMVRTFTATDCLFNYVNMGLFINVN
jgi:hypothetical protein